MEKRPFLREQIARLRAQRWAKEALLALLLTVAALVFIATAIVSRNSQDKMPFETARPQ
jgi:hypothetical protein